MSDDRTVMRRGGSGLCEQARRREGGYAGGEEGTSGEKRHWKKMTDEGWWMFYSLLTLV
jgi:hypothetical protein